MRILYPYDIAKILGIKTSKKSKLSKFELTQLRKSIQPWLKSCQQAIKERYIKIGIE